MERQSFRHKEDIRRLRVVIPQGKLRVIQRFLNRGKRGGSVLGLRLANQQKVRNVERGGLDCRLLHQRAEHALSAKIRVREGDKLRLLLRWGKNVIAPTSASASESCDQARHIWREIKRRIEKKENP